MTIKYDANVSKLRDDLIDLCAFSNIGGYTSRALGGLQDIISYKLRKNDISYAVTDESLFLKENGVLKFNFKEAPQIFNSVTYPQVVVMGSSLSDDEIEIAGPEKSIKIAVCWPLSDKGNICPDDSEYSVKAVDYLNNGIIEGGAVKMYRKFIITMRQKMFQHQWP